jgi:uncharacterized protein (DUF488 family)
MTAPITLYTIGHSTRSLEEFVDLILLHEISNLVDVRSMPGSTKFPHFNKEGLETELPKREIAYTWLEKLGGRRRGKKGVQSPNLGLESPAFRSFADYMAEDTFKEGILELLNIAGGPKTAYFCAEAVYWRCHRRLISDYVVLHGQEVLHIINYKEPLLHKLTPGATLTSSGDVIYPPLVNNPD